MQSHDKLAEVTTMSVAEEEAADDPARSDGAAAQE
jgi:hypothetical protein